MSKLIITTEEDLERVAKGAFYLLVNLRKATVKWEKEHGTRDKEIKKNWEAKVDSFIRDPLSLHRFHADCGITFEKE